MENIDTTEAQPDSPSAESEELRKQIADVFEMDMLKLSIGRFDDTITQVVGIFAQSQRAALDKAVRTARLDELDRAGDHWWNCDGDNCEFNSGKGPCGYDDHRREELAQLPAGREG